MAAPTINLIIDSEKHSQRLDAFLGKLPQIPSRTHAARLLADDCVSVNGRRVKPSYSLKENDEICIRFLDSKPSSMAAEDIPLTIIFEDEDLLVLNKPKGLVVHPGAGHPDGTLTQALLFHCGKLSSIGGVDRPGIVHRLDKGTSGLMVVAKNDRSHLNLARQFKEHTIVKRYVTLIYGRISPLEQTIENKITRNERNRKKYIVHPHRGKLAISKYRVLKQNDRFSLLEVQILTGRTHQIRVHMVYKACSIVGDMMYGQRKRYKNMEPEQDQMLEILKEPLLHACFLEFRHPKTGKRLRFKSPMPPEFEAAVKLFL